MDVTEQDELRKKSEENRPIVAVLMLDNYEELMKAGTEAARSSVLAQIDEKISAWVSGTQGLLCKYDRNRYLLSPPRESAISMDRPAFLKSVS